jgi:hypothetical protein
MTEQEKAKAMLARLMTPEGMKEFHRESERAVKEWRRQEKERKASKKK